MGSNDLPNEVATCLFDGQIIICNGANTFQRILKGWSRPDNIDCEGPGCGIPLLKKFGIT